MMYLNHGIQDVKIMLPLLKGNMIVMKPSEIKYIRSDGPVVYIVDINDQQIVGNQPLKFYNDLFTGESFFQVSQSILVNMQRIKIIDVGNQEIELECGKRLTISRNGLRDLKEYIKLNNYRL